MPFAAPQISTPDCCGDDSPARILDAALDVFLRANSQDRPSGWPLAFTVSAQVRLRMSMAATLAMIERDRAASGR